jgi:hypothetical protein
VRSPRSCNRRSGVGQTFLRGIDSRPVSDLAQAWLRASRHPYPTHVAVAGASQERHGRPRPRLQADVAVAVAVLADTARVRNVARVAAGHRTPRNPTGDWAGHTKTGSRASPLGESRCPMRVGSWPVLPQGQPGSSGVVWRWAPESLRSSMSTLHRCRPRPRALPGCGGPCNCRLPLLDRRYRSYTSSDLAWRGMPA